MTASSVASVITSGITDLGSGLATIFAGVIVLYVAVYVFRKGLHWLKASGR